MEDDRPDPARSPLVLVTGVGRSGTSLMAGTLHHLGLHVPGPFLGANRSNPKGFFESRWSTRFHNELTRSAGVHIADGRPEAWQLVQDAITSEHRARLRSFLSRHLRPGRAVAVKDPRTVWTQPMWSETARDLGADLGFVMMLRHPAEVVASRTTYYAGDADAAERRRYVVAGVARWVNQTLVSERHTRGRARCFVRYTDMLEDWRAVARAVSDKLAVSYPVDIDAPSPVDDFVDPSLRRHGATWSDTVSAPLRDLAEEVWDAVQLLVEQPEDPAATVRLDECARRYQNLVDAALDLTQDWRAAAPRAHAELPPSPPAQERAGEPARPVDGIPARELATALARRVKGRAGRAVARRRSPQP